MMLVWASGRSLYCVTTPTLRCIDRLPNNIIVGVSENYAVRKTRWIARMQTTPVCSGGGGGGGRGGRGRGRQSNSWPHWVRGWPGDREPLNQLYTGQTNRSSLTPFRYGRGRRRYKQRVYKPWYRHSEKLAGYRGNNLARSDHRKFV